MAATAPIRPAPFGAIATLQVVQIFYNAAETLGRWRDQRATRAALSKLSDRELEDIGLCRADIETVAARLG
ncbi:hypothetical protein C2I36_04550 [Rhodobacteraceae bacterium WD3A24]|nr:hypothetical protein C2I36_04550 [Rhodobacteraceae bacterium WD3A24]